VAVAAHYGSNQPNTEAQARVRAREMPELVGLPTDPASAPPCSRRRAQESSKLARALATGPTLLLADESLGGLDHRRCTTRRRCSTHPRELGITIVWVEHIMATLMRVVDRIVVLDHGEKIADGPPLESRSIRS